MPPLKTYELHHNEYPLQTSATTETQMQERQPQNSAQILLDTKGNFFSNQYSQKLLMNLFLLRQNSRFCDVEIVAGGRVFNAHRIILSASSAYFEAMFRPELGLSEGRQRSVVLYSIDPNILQMLLDFIYTGRIEINQVSCIILCSIDRFLRQQHTLIQHIHV